MGLIKKMYHYVAKMLREIKWNLQLLILRKQIKKNRNFETSLKGNVLILAPHSDDEWIGCSQIINDKDLIVEICNMNMDGGDSESMHSERVDEMMNVANNYSRKIVTLQGDKINGLVEVFNCFKPDYVCIPFLVDWHKEHRDVMRTMDEAIKSSRCNFNICMYQVSVPIPEDIINYGLMMTRKSWKDKWQNFISYYPSQLYIPYKRFAINERINGKMRNTYALEAYSLMTINVWRKSFNNAKEIENEIANLVGYISDLVKIRIKTDQICKKILKNN